MSSRTDEQIRVKDLISSVNKLIRDCHKKCQADPNFTRGLQYWMAYFAASVLHRRSDLQSLRVTFRAIGICIRISHLLGEIEPEATQALLAEIDQEVQRVFPAANSSGVCGGLTTYPDSG